MSSRDDYDKPRIPPGTPPVIDPNAKPKTAREMEEDGEEEGEVLGHRSNPDEIDTELSEKLRKRQDRDGKGEQALDTMNAETKLPPG